ncbi:hypothetical protein TRFO_15431 [Tritrichomonas foetus]|uniref:C2 domain-containing protein n=1 Tax=Tritrichomonas foetus TaxID=1144522 RepID=A0A1J4KSM8_9EUKA|nr:hypothetical protein TRFO_15431 [Tritrichomonas foetus]|eukprot:OHT14267.1 hypothetical protein TRFO_15431 [Tritrichomonas foetus]
MSDLKLFGINIIKGENMPVEQKLSLCVYLVGAIRTLLIRTSIKSGPNPEWSTNVNFPNPVRGLHLHFEVVSHNKKKEKVVAIGDFDPRIQKIRENQSDVAVMMFVLEKTQPYQDRLTSVYFRIHYMPMIAKPNQPLNILTSGNIPNNPTFFNPFYLTVDPANTIFAKNASENYRTPYELSVALLNENEAKCHVINSGNRIFKGQNSSICGVNHSGTNLSGTITSLSQSIRIDPKIVALSNIKFILVILSSPKYVPLKSVMGNGINPVDAVVTTWSTTEPCGLFQKSQIYNLTSIPHQTMKIGGQFMVNFNDEPIISIVAVGKVNGDQIQFEPFDGQIPNQQMQIAPQDPAEIMNLICKNIKFHKEQKQTVEYRSQIQFPLLIPRSLNSIFNLSSDPVIFARASACLNHNFTAMAVNSNYEQLFVCSKQTPQQGRGSLVFGGQGITADLSKIPANVSFIFFTLFGNSTLYTDLVESKEKSKNKGNKEISAKENSENNLVCFLNNETVLLNQPYMFSRTKNSLMWFALFRDAFGGWGLINVRRGEYATDMNNLRLIFIEVMKKCMTAI